MSTCGKAVTINAGDPELGMTEWSRPCDEEPDHAGSCAAWFRFGTDRPVPPTRFDPFSVLIGFDAAPSVSTDPIPVAVFTPEMLRNALDLGAARTGKVPR